MGRQRQKGNVLTEFGIHLGLVVSLSLAAVFMLNGNLVNLLKSATSSKIDLYANQIFYAGNSQMQPLASRSGQVTFTTNHGTKINLSNLSGGDMRTLVVTDGANGATSIMADMLNQLAHQLLAAGEISQAQSNALIALANKGHELAKVEAQLKQLSTNATSQAAFSQVLQHSPDLVYTHRACGTGACRGYEINLGFTHGDDPNAAIMASQFNATNSVGKTKEFINAYGVALAEGGLSDPAVKELVDALSENIVYISQMASSATSGMDLGTVPTGNMDQYIISSLSHQDSNVICTSGNGVVANLQCAN